MIFEKPKYLQLLPIPSVEMIKVFSNIPTDMAGEYAFYLQGSLSKIASYPGGLGRPDIALLRSDFEGVEVKVVFTPKAAPGVWFRDGFSWVEGVTDLILTAPPGETPPNTHKISGQCLRDGAPFGGVVHIVSATDKTHLDTAQASFSTGQWAAEIATGGAVYAFVSIPYGRTFEPNLSVAVGDVLHPTAANGYTYEVIQGGQLDPTEPSPWLKDKSFASGTAILNPKPYPAPQIHGPIIPAPI